MKVPIIAIVKGERRNAVLTTEHAASSYNIPVVVLSNKAQEALGSTEVDGLVVPSRYLADAERGGYKIAEVTSRLHIPDFPHELHREITRAALETEIPIKEWVEQACREKLGRGNG